MSISFVPLRSLCANATNHNIWQIYSFANCNTQKTRKPNCRWQTRATRKHAKNCSNSTCLRRCV